MASHEALIARASHPMSGFHQPYSTLGLAERLKSIIKQLQRARFGRRSERLDPDQLAPGLEDLDGDIARAQESAPRIENQQSERTSHRKPLPDNLPRDDVRLDINEMIRACCGGALHAIGESVSEMLDWVPAQLHVIRTTRPKYACRACDTTVVQAPAPERLIAGDLATPAPLVQVPVSKYYDHTPLYRQSQIFALASISRIRRSSDRSAPPAGGLRRFMSAWLKMTSKRA